MLTNTEFKAYFGGVTEVLMHHPVTYEVSKVWDCFVSNPQSTFEWMPDGL